MIKIVSSILIMLCAMSSEAQSLTAPDSENTGVAVFKGDVRGVPDGTVVNFWMPENGDYIGEAVAKVTKGKFTFKKKINDYTKYIITLGDAKEELVLRTASGTTTITGDNADCSHWRVENDNPVVVEENAYRDRRKFIREEYEKKEKLNEAHNPDIYASEHFYIKSMCEFMKKRSYNRFYMDELRNLVGLATSMRPSMAINAWNRPTKNNRVIEYRKRCSGEREYRNMISELCVKVPFGKLGEFQNLYTDKVLDVGDFMIDFTLYDRKGKEHHLNEFSHNGKYLLLEFCCKEDKDLMKSRPEGLLNELYDKYSNNLDIVTVNCDSKDAWKSGKLPRDKWNEWNDYKNSIAVMMEYSTLFRYVFISPDDEIIGFGNSDDLMDKAEKHFAFLK